MTNKPLRQMAWAVVDKDGNFIESIPDENRIRRRYLPGIGERVIRVLITEVEQEEK